MFLYEEVSSRSCFVRQPEATLTGPVWEAVMHADSLTAACIIPRFGAHVPCTIRGHPKKFPDSEHGSFMQPPLPMTKTLTGAHTLLLKAWMPVRMGLLAG